LNAKENTLNNVVNLSCPHRLPFSYYGNQWDPSAVWLTTLFKTSDFVFSRTKKLILV